MLLAEAGVYLFWMKQNRLAFFAKHSLPRHDLYLPSPGMSLLKVEHLSKTFGAIRAADSVSFEVRPGEIYGLLGPNGAGKTTTISMISGLLKPDAGEVSVGGKPFWSNPQQAKRIMGVVPQELAMYE